MRSRLVYILAILLGLCSCTDDSYMGAWGEIYGAGYQPIPVMVSFGDPTGGLVKGNGAIDSAEEWNEGYVYIYAFSNGPESDYRYVSQDAPYECLIDGSVSEAGSLAGRRAYLGPNDAYARWTDDKQLYYPAGKYRRMTYDFFSYFLDDVKVSDASFTRTKDRAQVKVEIDGTQDLMHSKAAVTSSQLDVFSSAEKEMVLDRAYGYYTAQRDVVPTFNFKHMLVRLEFEMIPGVVTEENKIITVHSIEVESKSHAEFVVAAKDESVLGLHFEDGRKRMKLTEEGGVPMKDDAYVIRTRPSYDVKAEPVKVGGCLLIAPESEYNAYIVMSEVRDDGSTVVKRATTPVQISFKPEVFEPGKQYKVKMTIYGATQVRLSVEVEKWREGGNVEMDPDKEMENN